MIPQKYKFYIGKPLKNVKFTNSFIDIATGEYINSDNNLASNKIEVNGFNKVYINYKTSYVYIALYDENNAYISRITLQGTNSSADNIAIEIPVTAKYIAFVFGISVGNYNDTNISRIIKTDFIYGIKSIVPHYKSISKKYEKESGQEFFRESIDGKITVFGLDYEYINTSDIEDAFMFIILSDHDYKYTVYYKGTFSKTDCKFDHDKKSCELGLTTIDNYSNILDKYENSYDIIKLSPHMVNIRVYKRPLIQIYVQGSGSISNFFGGTYFETDVDEIIDSKEDLVNKYHFAYINAGTEFEIKDAGISEINGVYAGINGEWTSGDGKYILKAEGAYTTYKYYIYRKSDNARLYYSGNVHMHEADDIYIDENSNVLMISYDNSEDRFYLANIFNYFVYCRLLCDVDSTINSDDLEVSTYDIPKDDFASYNQNYKKCIGLIGGTFYCSSYTVDKPTKYGMNDYGKYFTNEFIPLYLGYRPLPICKSFWVNSSLWFLYNISYTEEEKNYRKSYISKNNYDISSVIKVLLNKIDPLLKHECTAEYSRFLYDIDTPLDMERFYVCITQKSNILKGNYDQAAQKANTSLKEIMDMLRDCFKCYWYIEDYKFKIEHISFFINGGSYKREEKNIIDITSMKDMFNKKSVLYFQSNISYNKSELPSRYEFSWADNSTDLFDNVIIDVKSNYIQGDKNESVNSNNFSSDVDYMLFRPSDFSDDGFALLCPIKINDSYELPIITITLLDENKIEYEATVQNWYASWNYLIKFYLYDMPAYNVECNTRGRLNVKSIKRCMEHEIEIINKDDINIYAPVKTKIGNGIISGMSINLDTQLVKMKLLYEPK